MKHTVRDAIVAMLDAACRALPGAERPIGGATTAGGAYASLLFAHIADLRARGLLPDPEGMARTMVEHPLFAEGMGNLAAKLADARPGKNAAGGKKLTLAGVDFAVRWGAVTVGGYDVKPSHAEDRLVTWRDVTPCAARRDEIVASFRTTLAAKLPDVDRETVAFEMRKGRPGVRCRTWTTAYRVEDTNVDLPFDAAHCAMEGLIKRIERSVGDMRRWSVEADRAHARTRELMERIGPAIAAIDPDLPLELVEAHPEGDHSHKMGKAIRVRLRFEGTRFDMTRGEVLDKVEDEIEHYIVHRLPHLVRAQQALRAATSADDPRDALIEAPVARLLMEARGDAWRDDVADIFRRRRGARGRIDDEMWTAKLEQGVVRGFFHLGRGATWDRGRVFVPGRMPETVLVGMRGRPLAEIVSHRLIGDGLVIVQAVNVVDHRGDWRIRITTDAPTLRLGDMEERALPKAA